MNWTDSRDIAIALLEKFPDQDPKALNFVDLRNWVIGLPEFSDEPNRSGEGKILEAIRWLDRGSGNSATRHSVPPPELVEGARSGRSR
jgi:FeS assembly protein IscX